MNSSAKTLPLHDNKDGSSPAKHNAKTQDQPTSTPDKLLAMAGSVSSKESTGSVSSDMRESEDLSC